MRRRGDGPFQIKIRPSVEMIAGLTIGIALGYLIVHAEAILRSVEHLLRLVA